MWGRGGRKHVIIRQGGLERGVGRMGRCGRSTWGESKGLKTAAGRHRLLAAPLLHLCLWVCVLRCFCSMIMVRLHSPTLGCVQVQGGHWVLPRPSGLSTARLIKPTEVTSLSVQELLSCVSGRLRMSRLPLCAVPMVAAAVVERVEGCPRSRVPCTGEHAGIYDTFACARSLLLRVRYNRFRRPPRRRRCSPVSTLHCYLSVR